MRNVSRGAPGHFCFDARVASAGRSRERREQKHRVVRNPHSASEMHEGQTWRYLLRRFRQASAHPPASARAPSSSHLGLLGKPYDSRTSKDVLSEPGFQEDSTLALYPCFLVESATRRAVLVRGAMTIPKLWLKQPTFISFCSGGWEGPGQGTG